MRNIEEVRRFFEGDRYAVEVTGIVIDKVDDCYSKCSLELDERHRGAHGQVMGGVMFTLADFAFAVAANSSSMHTVTLDGSVKYLKPGVGDKLTAVAKPVRLGRAVCVYSVTVDDGISDIAVCTFTGYRTGHKK